jgi:hypothetical protein
MSESSKEFLERMARIDPRSREERDTERQGKVFINRRASEPVLADLRKAGFNVRWVAELRRQGDYREAIPILLKWMPLMANHAVKSDIIRTLSVPWAMPEVWPLFLEEFRRNENDEIRWVVGNGIGLLADETKFDTLAELAQERQYGRGRQMIVLALGGMKDPRAVDVLISQLDDPQVAIMAIMALGTLRAEAARTHLESFLNDPIPEHRREAKKAIAAIDRALAKRSRK